MEGNDAQQVLEKSNPSARASGITVSQYLGLDLDSATDAQLSILMDMHMEVRNVKNTDFCRQSSRLQG